MEIQSIVIERLRSCTQLVNKYQLAAILGISPVTLTTRIKKGEVPDGEVILGKVRWRPDKLAEHLEHASNSEDRELTRRQVARHFGVVESTITKWLRGGKFIDPDRTTDRGRMFWKWSTIHGWEQKQTHGFRVGDLNG